MLWIVSGPSSVGKSTFIKSSEFCCFTGYGAGDAEVVFAYELNKKAALVKSGKGNVLLHYNIARTLDSLFKGGCHENYNYSIDDDKWDVVSNLKVEKKSLGAGD